MKPRIISPMLNMSPRNLVPMFVILWGLISSCSPAQPSSPGGGEVETPQTTDADVLAPAQTTGNESMELFSSDRLGLCFSYPQGYTQIPYNEAVEIVAPILGPGDEAGLFWLELSDPLNRTADQVAAEELNAVAGLSPGHWTVMLGGEPALVLDGMPGQNLVRRVYIVHQQTLYILTFSPARSENRVAGDQMEALYEAVTSSWTWSPCSASE